MSQLAIGLSLCLCLCAGGCGGLFAQPPVAKAYFAIEPGRIEPLDSTRPATQGNTVLRVRTLRVAPPYDGVAFVYRIGPAQFDTDYYNNFIAPPASLLTSGLIRWLSASCPMTVSDEHSDLRSDLNLEGNITSLYIDSTVTPSRAVVAGRFFVTRNKNGSIELLSDKEYETSVAVTSRSAPAFAAAWGEAWRQLLDQLAHDLCNLKSAQSQSRSGGRGSRRAEAGYCEETRLCRSLARARLLPSRGSPGGSPSQTDRPSLPLA